MLCLCVFVLSEEECCSTLALLLVTHTYSLENWMQFCKATFKWCGEQFLVGLCECLTIIVNLQPEFVESNAENGVFDCRVLLFELLTK